MLRQSTLYEIQQSAGASFIQHRDWETAERFSSIKDEYEVLKSLAGLIDLSSAGVLELAGPDRVRFLHGMITNDVKALQPGRGCYALMLSPQGKTLADLQVYCLEESFLLTIEADLREKLLSSLKKYVIGDRVDLQDRSEDLTVLSLQGPASRRFLTQINSTLESLEQPYDHMEIEINHSSVRVCKVNRSGRGGYDLIFPHQQLMKVWNRLLEKGSPLGIRPVGLAAFNIHRVEAGIPWYGFDLDDSNIPLEAGLSSAISFNKGCYVGQETIARATYVGHVNRRLMGLLLAGEAPASKRDKVLSEEKEVGWVTSSIYSLALQRPIAMAYLRREIAVPGKILDVVHADSSIGCQVTTLPFVAE